MAFGKFGRYYPDGVDVRVARFDLVALLEAEVKVVAEDTGAHHTIRFTSDTPQRVVETDPQHVRFVAVNLLQNAVKYSDAGTEVDVVLTTTGETIELRVSDHGIGIPDAEVEALFSPFYRASNAVARPGTGMGLPIVKKSANLIGATVDVRTTLGEGTTFSVVLPGSIGVR